jgi:peptidoglycan/xylan/chitin deacetylase (PgdA/CDA1 family)
MTPWQPLAEELDRWAEAGRVATFWWRDDDAATATPALDRLMVMRRALGAPVAIAAVPARADATLRDALAAEQGWDILQHGWAHENHAPEGESKAELGPHRPPAEIAAELVKGWLALADLFGARLLPALVPPWNRIGAAPVATLPALGYAALSTFAPRDAREAAPGLVVVNTHVDIVDWPGTRAFCGDATAVEAACAHLRARREGEADAAEPTGLLTHHLAHDNGCWDFIGRFVSETADHRAAKWLSAAEAFAA